MRNINPGRTAVCNNIDDNCNNQVADGLIFTIYYEDIDGDNYGDLFDPGDSACTNPRTGFLTNNLECNDSEAAINPVAIETCNDLYDDCDPGFEYITLSGDEDFTGDLFFIIFSQR